MSTAVVYVHGKDGLVQEAEHFKTLFPDCEVIGFDYMADNPWEAIPEFSTFFARLMPQYESIILIANSLGAYFSMESGIAPMIRKAFFISPIVDMEKLIQNMMSWKGVTEEELREQGVIPNEYGDDLSWEYLTYVREHPVDWDVPTEILYGDQDNLTSLETMTGFAEKHHAGLTVMQGGEHWFHTEEQMRFLDEWVMNVKAQKE
ncbi:MAG: alpha/beta hydrolase [Clostridia bacterium]|nr:alpha/beta hydrolase [Clostridia bacterium]